ncbi:putative nucleotidyltransferase-like protein [Blastococcus colisei]|uniref:Putative nucleotidyltransferase-like protein n=1 Tax=Blastococcus colisei TaxID=1564162 RepID=A0A543P0L6_9ACTN|nr:putative nucleotidyltransferase-like protein [Blastococcus colisei]
MRAAVAGSSTAVQPSERDEIRDLLKRTAVALKQGDVPFALCGGYAAWMRGAPEPDHDADFLVPEAEADRAAKVLADAGLQVQDPPEDWLTKVVSGGSFVDVLWRTCGRPVETDLIERAEVLPVLSVHMPVLTATDIVVTKLMTLDEHYCDFARMLPVARALREQVDWAAVEEAVADNDFAVVFLQLLDRLGVVPKVSAA